jgi:hypothetical protein
MSLSENKRSLSDCLHISFETIEDEFEALHAKVEQRLISCPYIPIEDNNTAPRHSGVYAIFLNRNLVYIGATMELKHRLREHRKTVRMATAISSDDVTYKFVSCGRHPSASIEGRLIEHYEPPWNKSGFGRRPRADARHQRPSAWDESFGALGRTIQPGISVRE